MEVVDLSTPSQFVFGPTDTDVDGLFADDWFDDDDVEAMTVM